MTTLTTEQVIKAVRKNLDEIGENPSGMFGVDTDNEELDTMIAKTLPEAINFVNAKAPVEMLDGIEATPDNVSVSEDGVLSFDIDDKVLRLVAFKTKDSDIVLVDVIPEASAEGRKQFNKYVRGTFDNPKLVMVQAQQSPSKFRYYTLREEMEDPIERLEYIPFEEFELKESYDVSEAVISDIIYKTTSMVLAIYGEAEKAQYFGSLSDIQ